MQAPQLIKDPPIGGVVPQTTDPPVGGVIGGSASAPDGPSALARMTEPVINIPVDLVKTVARLFGDPAFLEQVPEALWTNLTNHLSQAKQTMSRGPFHSGEAMLQAAGGLPLVGPTIDALSRGDVPSAIGEGAALGASAYGPGLVTRLASKIGKFAAPVMADAALGETKTMRAEFPNSARRAVSDRVITPKPVQAKLTATEKELDAIVGAADRSRPAVAGYLGPGTEMVPMGTAATGESAAMTSAQMPRPSMIDPRRLQGGGAAPMPFASAGTGPRPEAGFGGPGMAERPRVSPVTPQAGAAPPTMVAPMDILDRAKQFVIERAGLKGQGGRGLRADSLKKLEELAQQYLTENSRPMTLAETLAQKRAEQQLSFGAYQADDAGRPVTNIDQLFHEGIAAGAREALIDQLPPAANLLKQEQELIGLLDSSTRAMPHVGDIKRSGVISAGRNAAMGPTGLGRAALTTQSLSELLDQIAPWANRLTVGAQAVKK